METSKQLPIKGAKTIILLGILSFVGCGLYALPGTIISLIGIAKFKKVKAIAINNPAIYENAWVNARVGLILCILGFIASIITLIWTISLFYPIWFK